MQKFSLALRLGLVVSFASTSLPGVATEAAAFELFGIRLFGSDEADRDVIDPLNYTITLDTGAADRQLKKSLERTSLLLAEEDEPVSGDLGLVIKARDDRDRLIATLYENALYGGVVLVTIDGRDIDSLPPNPVFDRSRPVPVSITIQPGPTFTLDEVRLEGDAARLDPAEFDLVPGAKAGSLTNLRAAEAISLQLKEEGRPLTEVTRREGRLSRATDADEYYQGEIWNLVHRHDVRASFVKIAICVGPPRTGSIAPTNSNSTQ